MAVSTGDGESKRNTAQAVLLVFVTSAVGQEPFLLLKAAVPAYCAGIGKDFYGRIHIFAGQTNALWLHNRSCAAAAAKAAAMMLLSGRRIDFADIDTPKGVRLHLETHEVEMTPDYACCAIQKDSGDDPDDTNGILIYAKVEKTDAPEDIIEGGEGVGRVTKPGLACSVGGPAINPVPRKMILKSLRDAAEQFNYSGSLKVTISAPAGVQIAPKTFNPRLGIEGGISILGTSGIVEPMSDTALIETMYTEINVQAEKGNKDLLVFFGNYGEDFTRDNLQVDIDNAVTCSNFVGELLDYAVYKALKACF